jgi:hypothetical protein
MVFAKQVAVGVVQVRTRGHLGDALVDRLFEQRRNRRINCWCEAVMHCHARGIERVARMRHARMQVVATRRRRMAVVVVPRAAIATGAGMVVAGRLWPHRRRRHRCVSGGAALHNSLDTDLDRRGRHDRRGTALLAWFTRNGARHVWRGVALWQSRGLSVRTHGLTSHLKH